MSDGTTASILGRPGADRLPGRRTHCSLGFTATGPLALRGMGSAVDTYVPIAFAGTDFVIPTTRSVNRLWFYAPFGAADVSVEHSGTTTPVTVPVGTSITITTDITSNADAAVVTATEPVMATHTASGTTDAYVVVSATDDRLFGIRSTLHLTGFGQDGGTAGVTESDGGSPGMPVSVATRWFAAAVGRRGTGPAVIVAPSAGGSLAAIQQADSDGGESSAYWPESELNSAYRVATLSQHVAVACPEQGTGNVAVAGAPITATAMVPSRSEGSAWRLLPGCRSG